MSKLVTIAIFALTFIGCNEPTKEAQIFTDEQFGWTIALPPDFKNTSKRQAERLNKKGTEAIEKTLGEKIEGSATDILTMNSGPINYIGANYQPYDSTEFESYTESINFVNPILYQTLESQMPGAKLDSSSNIEKIDGLLFHVFLVKIPLQQSKTMKFALYSRLFGDKEFSFNIVTIDEDKWKSVIEAWRASKFERD